MKLGLGANGTRVFAGAGLAVAAGALALAVLPGTALALQCHGGTISFYDAGGIKSCEIEANHRFFLAGGGKIVCAGGHMLTQHPDGAVESCTLAEPFGGEEKTCETGQVVTLSPGGAILDCE
jgi:hypothetical protein